MTEQNMQDTILIPTPPKVWKNLFSWLEANVSDERDRISLACFWLDDNNTYWATNGYALVRAEIEDTSFSLVPPGYWFINQCTAKLIHFIKADIYNYPNVHLIWDQSFDVDQTSAIAFNPTILTKITKPFDRVTMHAKGYAPMHLLLGDPKSMPDGKYEAILMPMNVSDIQSKFKNSSFKIRQPLEKEEA